MKTKLINNKLFENIFKTRMDFKYISYRKLPSILNNPKKWQIVEIKTPSYMNKNHIMGSIKLSKIYHEIEKQNHSLNKKILLNGDFFDIAFYYHDLTKDGYKVYLFKNKPILYKSKNSKFRLDN